MILRLSLSSRKGPGAVVPRPTDQGVALTGSLLPELLQVLERVATEVCSRLPQGLTQPLAGFLEVFLVLLHQGLLLLLGQLVHLQLLAPLLDFLAALLELLQVALVLLSVLP